MANDVVQRLVHTAWSSADVVPADSDDPKIRAFAEFGLPPYSPLAGEGHLRDLEAWRDGLQLSPNSAFLDGTLLLTVEGLLGWNGNQVLTPVTLWELTAFIDALVCFDRLYCIANPIIDVSHINRRLGSDVLAAIPDPDGGVLRRLAADAASSGLSEMQSLSSRGGSDDAWGQEVRAVVNGWRAVLGHDIPSNGPFDARGIDADHAAYTNVDSGADLIDGHTATSESDINSRHRHLRVLIEATRLPQTPGDSSERPELSDRQNLAAFATYRTYVNQAVANGLGLPYVPGTLRMPFRRLFVERAAEVQDTLITVALADAAFAQLQPSAPMILPFFTAGVLQGAKTREDIWQQLARMRDRSTAFRRSRAALDRILERSQVSSEALGIQSALRDEALKLADIAGASQQAASVALGVVAQTPIGPLAAALQTGVDAAKGLGGGSSWRRIWRRLFHRDEYSLAQTNSQAIALTNALPKIQELWEMPKIGGYLSHFANATRQIGHALRESA